MEEWQIHYLWIPFNGRAIKELHVYCELKQLVLIVHCI